MYCTRFFLTLMYRAAPNDFNNAHTFVNSAKQRVNATLLMSRDAHRRPHHLCFLFFFKYANLKPVRDN